MKTLLIIDENVECLAPFFFYLWLNIVNEFYENIQQVLPFSFIFQVIFEHAWKNYEEKRKTIPLKD